MLQKRIIAFCTGVLFMLATQAQVNLQTGGATFSLPMFDWKEDKSRLKLMVALSYNSGNGIRAADISSNVGQGWSLLAGGAVSRMAVGEPDDQEEYGNNNDQHDATKYPAGYLYTNKNPGDGCPLSLTRYPIYGAKNEKYRQHNAVAADKQLDYFTFQFNGQTGMFVLDPVKGNVGASLGDSKMKISFETDPTLKDHGIRTTITSFTIQDVNGLIYRFKAHGLSKVLEAKYCDRSLTATQDQPNFAEGGVYHQKGFDNPKYVRPWVINNWYLSEIEDVFTHRKVIFNYSNPVTINNPGSAEVSYDSRNKYVTVSHKNSVEQVPVLQSINCPDGHTVTLKYDKVRLDLPDDKALTSIDITYTMPNKRGGTITRYLSRHQLNTTYFVLNRYGTPTSPYEQLAARLCLRSVKKYGPDLKEDSPPYTFDYFMGSNPVEDIVPPPNCISHDVWGYYNGDKTAGYNYDWIPATLNIIALDFNMLKGLCYLRNNQTPGAYLNPKTGYAKNGLLKQIIYPTGGTLAYEYAQNTGVLNGTTTEVGGVHVTKTSATDGGYSNNCSNPVITQYNFVLDNNGASSLWGLEMPDNSNSMSMHYEPEKRNYHWIPWKCQGGLFGCCYWAYQYPGIMGQTQDYSLKGMAAWMERNETALGVMSAVMSIIDIMVVVTGSTGVLSIVALALDVISSTLEVALSCSGTPDSDGTSVSYYSYDFNGISPLPMQYKRVEVVEGGGSTGRTVHEFTSMDDYPLWAETNRNLTSRQRFAPWAYGLPKLTTVYDAANKKVSQTQYEYDTTFTKRMIEPLAASAPMPLNQVKSSLVNCKCVVKKNISQRYTDWEKPEEYNANYQLTDYADQLGVELYPVYTGRTMLKKKYDRLFDKADATKYTETVNTYFYKYATAAPLYDEETDSYLPSTCYTIASDGFTHFKHFRYSSDFIGGVYDVMNANNMVSELISGDEMVDYHSSTSVPDQRANEYIQLSNGDIRPWRSLTGKNKNGLVYSGLSTDYTQVLFTSIFSYDASGNMVTAKDEGGRAVSNIYDYNDKYIVATVVNAEAAIDKPAYTSFETGTFGGWQLATTANYDDNNFVTGASSLNLSGNSCSASLNTAKDYILSFWANNSSVTVSGGATLIKSAPIVNGFTYYEYNIAAGTGSVSVSGSALIDELRLYPHMARMRTVTYDPIIGKTTDCDENNRLTYYEYDDLGRLTFIRDEHKDIVKMYEYNNVLRQNGCPGTYTNPQITAYFTKSDCVGDFIGSEVEYTIPADKYSSTISQEDADAKAEVELLTEGQAKANREGHCIPVYYNAGRTDYFETQSCAAGYKPGKVPYTVPARKYSSTVFGEVEKMEADEIKANGQGYANDPQHAICILDTDPYWVMIDGGQTECRPVDGKGHLFVQVRDENPNSPSYNAISFKDSGPSSQCPDGYPNDGYQSGYYIKQTCPGGPSYGDPVYIPVGAGWFLSPLSVEDANNQARQWAQEQANNTDGYCRTPMIGLEYNSNAPDWIRIELQSTTDYNGYYYFEIPSGYPNNASGHWSIPQGYYDVTFTPYNLYSWYYHDYVTCGDYKWDMYDPWTFHNVLFDNDCHYVSVGTNYY